MCVLGLAPRVYNEFDSRGGSLYPDYQPTPRSLVILSLPPCLRLSVPPTLPPSFRPSLLRPSVPPTIPPFLPSPLPIFRSFDVRCSMLLLKEKNMRRFEYLIVVAFLWKLYLLHLTRDPPKRCLLLFPSRSCLCIDPSPSAVHVYKPIYAWEPNKYHGARPYWDT